MGTTIRILLAFGVALFFAVPATVSAQAANAEAPHFASGHDTPVSFRTILHYSSGPWLAPDARVLHTPAEWVAWNHDMVRDGKAVAEEPVPAGVDWVKEVVLVATLGELPQSESLQFESVMRFDHVVFFSGHVDIEPVQSFSAPCHVIAFDRRYAGHIRLDGSLGLPDVRGYGPTAPAVPGAERPAPVAEAPRMTWGAIKAAYR
jgi:hypothetical protein